MKIGEMTVSPMDLHNQTLIYNAHPEGWVNPEPRGRYNLVVLGAGTAGLVTAAGAAGLGARVALIEKNLMGGDCLNVGCVPSKALIRAARAYADVRDAANFGVVIPAGSRVDFAKVMERMRTLRAKISPNDSVHRFKSLGIDVFLGEGRFTGRETIEVDGKELRFAKAVIATGARAAKSPVPGLEDAGYLTNETVFNLTELPERLAVIGAGPIGCELSQAFARFGSRVYLLQRARQVLPREDPDVAIRLSQSLIKDGITFVLGTKILRVSREGRDKIIHLESDGKTSELRVDEILVGVGRTPNIDGLNLEAAGVAYDTKDGVKVNDYLQTANPKIFAAGDICLSYKFTHVADAAARIVIQNALFPGKKKVSALTVPWCTYTDPEVAHVGMYEKDAKEQGITVKTFVQEFSEIDRAILDGEDEGLIKVHVREGTDKILGATIFARHAGEMISELTLAMVAGAGLKTISGAIHPYPTQAQAVQRLGDAYNRTRLTPLARKALGAWLALRR